MTPRITYHDRGDRILMVDTRSATERYTAWRPKPHTLGERESPKPPAPTAKEPRRIESKRRGPSMAAKAGNFAKASAAHLAAGRPQASDEQVSARFAICQGCSLFQATGEGSGTCLHKSCGCNLKAVGNESLLTPNKLRWAEQACPIGRWAAVQ